MTELMTIGEFARQVGLTAKALRLYDELELLPPAAIDPHNGYRGYAASQLERAGLVRTLRLVGMPLARIRSVIELPTVAAAQEIASYWTQVTVDHDTRARIVATLLDTLRNEASNMATSSDSVQVRIGTSHQQGGRDLQQDALVATPALLGVADGFGVRDDVAQTALTAYARGGLQEATTAVLPYLPDSGTTITAVTLSGSLAQIAHIGDARAWLVRAGEVRRLTQDHTVVAALIDAGQLTVAEARSHEHRSLLNRALTPGVAADHSTLELQAGDRLVLTTDGVHAVVPDLEPLLTLDGTPQETADGLAAATAGAGEPDNHTVVVADFS